MNVPLNGIRWLTANAAQFMGEAAALIDIKTANEATIAARDARIAELEAQLAELSKNNQPGAYQGLNISESGRVTSLSGGDHSPPAAVP